MATIPGVVADQPVVIEWGNAVAAELNNEAIKRDGSRAMTGQLVLAADPVGGNDASRKSYVDARDAANAAYAEQRNVDWYNAYTVPLAAQVANKINRSGDTMTGNLMVTGNPYVGQQGAIMHASGIFAANIHERANCNLHLFHSDASAGGAFNDGVWYAAFCGQTGNHVNGYIKQVGGNGVLLVPGSDYRLKDDLGPIDDPVGNLMALQPKHLRWKSDGMEFDGFIAHELGEVVPQAVDGEKDATNANGSIKAQMVDITQVVPLLTAALQEAHTMIADLTARLEALEAA